MVMEKWAEFMLGNILCESGEEVKRQKTSYRGKFLKVFVAKVLQISAD